MVQPAAKRGQVQPAAKRGQVWPHWPLSEFNKSPQEVDVMIRIRKSGMGAISRSCHDPQQVPPPHVKAPPPGVHGAPPPQFAPETAVAAKCAGFRIVNGPPPPVPRPTRDPPQLPAEPQAPQSTAVAADEQQQSATASSSNSQQLPCLTLDALLSLSNAGSLPCHFSDHSAALKHARDSGELVGAFGKEYSFWHTSERIPTILKPEGGGPSYFFSTTHSVEWNVSLLLANLRDDHLRLVVNGPEDNSGGIVKCSCSAMEQNYDHKREHAERRKKASWKPQSTEHLIWDFIFERADKTSCWLHPNWGDNNVAYGENPVAGTAVAAIQPPSTGRGGSGWKFFKFYKDARVTAVLKLDRDKNQIKKRDTGEWMAA